MRHSSGDRRSWNGRTPRPLSTQSLPTCRPYSAPATKRRLPSSSWTSRGDSTRNDRYRFTRSAVLRGMPAAMPTDRVSSSPAPAAVTAARSSIEVDRAAADVADGGPGRARRAW